MFNDQKYEYDILIRIVVRDKRETVRAMVGLRLVEEVLRSDGEEATHEQSVKPIAASNHRVVD